MQIVAQVSQKKRLREIFPLVLPHDTDTFLHFHLSPIALLPPHLFFFLFLSGQSSLILFRGIFRKTLL